MLLKFGSMGHCKFLFLVDMYLIHSRVRNRPDSKSWSDLCCISAWVSLFVCFLHICVSSQRCCTKNLIRHLETSNWEMITLPICRQQYSSFNDDKRGIFHTLINTSFASRSSCAFFVQGGLSPPEFCCAFFKAQKVPPWNEISAPQTRKKRPPDGKKAPSWKGGSTHKFPAAHQKGYMGHSVRRYSYIRYPI